MGALVTVLLAGALGALGSLCILLAGEFTHPDHESDARRVSAVASVCWLVLGVMAGVLA